MKALVSGDLAGMKAAVMGMGQEIAGAYDSMVAGAQETKKRIASIWSGAQSSISGGAGAPTGFGVGGSGSKTGGGVRGNAGDPLRDAWELHNQIEKIRAKERQSKDALSKWTLANDKRLKDELGKNAKREGDLEIAVAEQVAKIKHKLMETEKAAQREKLRMAGEYASATVELGYAVFGESKELAIASSVVNTYRAAIEVLPNYYLAALVIATGLAQVAKIASTQPSGSGDVSAGRGFDDPRNDQAAYVGGRRWAADMIGEFTKGVSSGWASGMGAGGGSTSNTYDNRRTFNVHMHGAGLIDPNNVQMMKQFKRTLDVIDSQVEGQRSVARRARS